MYLFFDNRKEGIPLKKNKKNHSKYIFLSIFYVLSYIVLTTLSPVNTVYAQNINNIIQQTNPTLVPAPAPSSTDSTDTTIATNPPSDDDTSSTNPPSDDDTSSTTPTTVQPPTSASPDTDTSTNDKTASSYTEEELEEIATEILNNGSSWQKGALNTVIDSNQNSVASAASSIIGELSNLSFMKEGGGLSSFYEGFTIIGYALITLYFVMAIIDKISMQQMTIEQFFQVFIKVVIAKVIIENGWTLISALFDVGVSVSEALGYTASFVGTNYSLYAEDILIIQNGNLADLLGVYIDYLALGAINWICLAIISIIMWSILIEIGVKSIFAPIAFAEIVTTGIHGPGMRYLKKLFVLDLQFASIILSLIVCNILSVSIRNTSVAMGTMANIIVGLISIFTVVKASSYVNDVIRP